MKQPENRWKLTPERLFLLLFIPLVLATMFAMPFGGAPDEAAHMRKIWLVSTGQFHAESYEYPANLSDLLIGLIVDGSRPEKNAEGFGENLSEETVRREGHPATEVYPSMAYLPQSLTLAIARLFTGRISVLLYAARLGGAGITALLFWLAVRRIPYGKMILIAVACAPVTLQEAASASCDGMTIAGISLVIATFLQTAQERQVSGRTILRLSLLAAGTVIWKVMYFPALLLVFALPGQTPEEKNGRRKAAAAVFAAGLCALAVWAVASVWSNMSGSGRIDSSVAQAGTLLQQPGTFLAMQWNTLLRHGAGWIRQVFGVLGHLDRFSPLALEIPIVALFAGVCVLDTKVLQMTEKKQRVRTIILMLLVFILCWTVLSGALAIWSTEKDATEIDGIQGRYFLPVILCVLLCLPGIRMKEKAAQRVLPAMVTLFSLLSLVTVLILY